MLRAAVSAFCSLTRPSRREAAQLEDLALPLLDKVSPESLRYVSAALSECSFAPNALVRRLCEEPVELSAPLLIRSAALTDVDLIALIGRHGLPHARAIGRRDRLHPTIAQLVRALEAQQGGPPPSGEPAAVGPVRRRSGAAAEEVRRRLRGMMQDAPPDRSAQEENGSRIYARLRDTALTANPAFFQTAIADALETDFSTAQAIAGSGDLSQLMLALKALDLREEQAFLIACSVVPWRFAHSESIRRFLQDYRLIHREAALERRRSWKAAAIASAVGRPANSDAPVSVPFRPKRLKAS